MANTSDSKNQYIYIKNNGTRTLYTAGKYLNNDIVVDVNIAQAAGSSNNVDGLEFDTYPELLEYMNDTAFSSYIAFGDSITRVDNSVVNISEN